MTIDELARLSAVDERLKVLTNKQDQGTLTDDEKLELQKLLDEYELLIDKANTKAD